MVPNNLVVVMISVVLHKHAEPSIVSDVVPVSFPEVSLLGVLSSPWTSNTTCINSVSVTSLDRKSEVPS